MPAFLGSTLRGAFGHALKDAVCLMSHRDCSHCLVADRCIYPYLFETPAPADVPQLRGQQQAPHPFILAPPGLLKSAGDRSSAKKEHLPQPSSQAVSSHSTASLKRGLPGGVPVLRKASPVMPGEMRMSSSPPNERLKFAAGDELRFRLTLMGRATDYLSYVIYAVSEMARRGLGYERAGFALGSVAVLDEFGELETIYTASDRRSLVPIDAVSNLSDLLEARLQELERDGSRPGDRVKLRFTTPTRIRVEGDLQTSLSFELLIRNLLRRVSMLIAVHGESRLDLDYKGLIARAASVRIHQASLSWHDWQRYSNRQETKMKLGGFIGDIEYRGEAIAEFLPLLVAGEILHVGTGTSFGLGKYEMVG
ncbi:MAG TPA: CRISPR system precrRNA processing endoribonuclease RAMP protein Cas6 [Blastocatellia bacterium]|nr:CRISPR system precrRNA processing endoribonuclease RAMP protein Cas6 [Blastocatellia bacterium]